MSNCPICLSPGPNIDVHGLDADVFDCPKHRRFGIARTARARFDNTNEHGQERAIQKAKDRDMTMGYPVVNDFDF